MIFWIKEEIWLLEILSVMYTFNKWKNSFFIQNKS